MSKDAFWALIQEAKTACGQDLDAMEDYLRERLVSMGPAAAKDFHDILQAYEDLADQYGLWDAASVIKEYGCSDDGFIDFRAWLIARVKRCTWMRCGSRIRWRMQSHTAIAVSSACPMWAITPMSSSPAAAPMTRWSRTGWEENCGTS